MGDNYYVCKSEQNRAGMERAAFAGAVSGDASMCTERAFTANIGIPKTRGLQLHLLRRTPVYFDTKFDSGTEAQVSLSRCKEGAVPRLPDKSHGWHVPKFRCGKM